MFRIGHSPLNPQKTRAQARVTIGVLGGILLVALPKQASALSFEEADLPAGVTEWHVHLIAFGLAILLAIVCVIPFIWRRHD